MEFSFREMNILAGAELISYSYKQWRTNNWDGQNQQHSQGGYHSSIGGKLKIINPFPPSPLPYLALNKVKIVCYIL